MVPKKRLNRDGKEMNRRGVVGLTMPNSTPENEEELKPFTFTIRKYVELGFVKKVYGVIKEGVPRDFYYVLKVAPKNARELMIKNMVERAMNHNTAATEYIIDRLEGKPFQNLNVGGTQLPQSMAELITWAAMHGAKAPPERPLDIEADSVIAIEDQSETNGVNVENGTS